MKKLLILVVAVILGIGTTFAGSVDVNTAKIIGQKFVQANFANTRANLELVYTIQTERGDAGFYVFNVDENGFVIVSADENFRPIVGFSDEGAFDADNISPEFAFYMNAILKGKEQKGNVSDPKVTEEWSSVMSSGRLLSYNNGRGVDYLVQTKWNQNPAPYNSMCPADPLGPGGHAYVGCVATAMSQVMKFWNYPTQGQGSHSYVCTANPYAGYAGHPEYGTLTANFGATTYDWDNMLNTYSSGNYTTEQGDAVATLCYHAGVSVDMMYGNTQDNGSGAYSDDVLSAATNYFLYSSQITQTSYSNITTWKNYLKEQFDLGWPVYHSGSSTTGGHAFVCDGYNDNDLFHYNWGWGGSDDGWFVVTEIDFNSNMRIIRNFVPADIYNNTIQAPTNMTVTKTSDVAQEATITWTNPSKTLTNQNVTSISQMVVERNGVVIYTAENATPGANMSFVDSDVPCYSTFEYRVYAVQSGAHGKYAAATESFGPTCEWKITATAQSMQGWNGAYLVAYDGAGREINSVTMTNNTPANIPFDVTIGKVSFAWQAGSSAVTLSFKIKDSTGATMYDFSGSSDEIPEGMFYSVNNGCGSAAPTDVPGNLRATTDGDNITLSWDGTKTTYGYNVYRDGYLINLVHGDSFVDENPGLGGHCYQVCTLTEGGESSLSNEACANAGEGCEAASNLWYTPQANGKPTITWSTPANAEGLSGYFVYRKTNEDGEYERVKIVAANKTEYKETKTLVEGNWYYYKVVAYYQDIDCNSAPAKSANGYEFFVKILYPVYEGVEEDMAQNVSVYPNPAKDNITVEAENISNVVIYNSIGQTVFAKDCNTEKLIVNTNDLESGIYMVKIVANGNTITKKVSVVR